MTRTVVTTGPNRAPWAMFCDTEGCPTRSSYRAAETDLPVEEFRAAGWLVSATGSDDRCPACVRAGHIGLMRRVGRYGATGIYTTVAELIADLSRLPLGAPVVLSEDSEGHAPAHLAVNVSTALFGTCSCGVGGALWSDADLDPVTPADAVRAVVLWPAESFDRPGTHEPARDAHAKALAWHTPVRHAEDTTVCAVCQIEVCEVRVGLGLPAIAMPDGTWGPTRGNDTGEEPF